MTKLSVSGLANGSYAVTLDGTAAGTLTSAGQPVDLMLAIDAGPAHQLQIGSACVHAPASGSDAAGASGSTGGVGVVASGGANTASSAATGGSATSAPASEAGAGAGASAAVSGKSAKTPTGCHCNALAARRDAAPAALLAGVIACGLIRRRRKRGARTLKDRSR